MRIEKLSPKSYRRVLDKTEAEISNVINKYFNSTIFEENAANSREAIVQEITARIQPLIMSLAQTMAQKQIQDYVSGELGAYIDGKIIEITSAMKKIQVRYDSRKFKIGAADDKTQVMLPNDFVLDVTRDVLFVYVNGAEQEITDNYVFITNNTKVIGVSFTISPEEGPALEEGDTVVVGALIYSDGGVVS